VADIVFNAAKGAAAYLATLPAAADSIIVVPIETTGIVADATMQDYTTLSALLAGASNEQTTMGRKTATNVTVTVDQTNDRVDVDMDDITWSAATGNPISALVVCYKPDTASADTAIVPLTKHDFAATPDGTDLSAQVASGGFYRST
jgi:hypothetical protein